ncbi:LuxR C-terminal-related transcriptional regulator [bacterium]|nr:LuxR C-terminal-related transcriptional regulator [bacterium]MBU1994277.1 LuxR C-terminal-related transcriptional regulator [bacterium]
MKHLLLCSKRLSVSERISMALSADGYSVSVISQEELLAMRQKDFLEYDLLLMHLFNVEDIEILNQMNPVYLNTLILDSEPSLAMAIYILKWGANGYSNALASKTNLRLAVEVAISNNIYLPENYMSEMLGLINIALTKNSNQLQQEKLEQNSNPFTALTYREREVANCIVKGYNNKEIAKKLEITPRTVKAHLHSMFEKFHLRDRLSLALFLQKH